MERCFMSTRCDHNTIIMLSTECAKELRHIILEAEEQGRAEGRVESEEEDRGREKFLSLTSVESDPNPGTKTQRRKSSSLSDGLLGYHLTLKWEPSS
jgi:hypothetical protein